MKYYRHIVLYILSVYTGLSEVISLNPLSKHIFIRRNYLFSEDPSNLKNRVVLFRILFCSFLWITKNSGGKLVDFTFAYFWWREISIRLICCIIKENIFLCDMGSIYSCVRYINYDIISHFAFRKVSSMNEVRVYIG